MNFTYVPLLQIQREIQGMPRNYTRFRQYLRTIVNERRDDLRYPPLVAANPMAKDHVTALLDELLALDAEGVAARVTAEAAAELAEEPGYFKVSLVVADDAMGGWTNRFDYEFMFRFYEAPASDEVNPGWLVGLIWSSEPASVEAVREAVLMPIYRFAYYQAHGPARTLRDRMAQEGQVMARAGCQSPTLDAEDIEYTRAVLAPHLGDELKRTCIECLFGDAAAKTLGFTPRGLSPWAGLALALHDARIAHTR
jgi:hypothetical protein